MGLNRTAKGIVLVPSLLLGAAFLSAAVWGEAPEARPLALGLGLALLAGGLLAQLLPEGEPENTSTSDDETKKRASTTND
jgi:predicted phage tail protein